MGLEVSFILRENENSKSVHFPLPCFAKGNTRLSLFFFFRILLLFLFIVILFIYFAEPEFKAKPL